MTKDVGEYRMPGHGVGIPPAMSCRSSQGLHPALCCLRSIRPNPERLATLVHVSGLTGGERNLMIQTVMTVCMLSCMSDNQPSPFWAMGAFVQSRGFRPIDELPVRRNEVAAPINSKARTGSHPLSLPRAGAPARRSLRFSRYRKRFADIDPSLTIALVITETDRGARMPRADGPDVGQKTSQVMGIYG